MPSTLALDLVVLAGGSPSGVGSVIDIIDAANRVRPSGKGEIHLRVLAVDGGRTPLRGGIHLDTTSLRRHRARDVVLIAGIGAVAPDQLTVRLADADTRLVADWLGDGRGRGAILGAACTATFLLGEAGALDDRRCTTTWWLARYLAGRYPRAKVEPDEMLVVDKTTWTGGAAFSHIDLTMEVVRHHLGEDVANEVANRMAVDRRRMQSGYRLVSIERTTSPEAELIESIVLADLRAPVSLQEVAVAARLSPRTLHRRVHAATGYSPMQVARRTRLRVAIELLRTTDASVAEVAASVGLSDSATLYRLTTQVVGKAPSQLRGRPAKPKPAMRG
jgi:transcriptional regulator GlxA family with amidase domain